MTFSDRIKYYDTDTAVISGEIHTGSLTGAEIASFNTRYPYIRVTADHTSSVIYFYNGSTLLGQKTVAESVGRPRNGEFIGAAGHLLQIVPGDGASRLARLADGPLGRETAAQDAGNGQERIC